MVVPRCESWLYAACAREVPMKLLVQTIAGRFGYFIIKKATLDKLTNEVDTLIKLDKLTNELNTVTDVSIIP